MVYEIDGVKISEEDLDTTFDDLKNISESKFETYLGVLTIVGVIENADLKKITTIYEKVKKFKPDIYIDEKELSNITSDLIELGLIKKERDTSYNILPEGKAVLRKNANEIFAEMEDLITEINK
ncbi:MAG: hypothetical protein JSW73_02435 [Candidatus Woesearchaeota archaeon]|nr:MAG: hypothetical protein JSW73_02435 [Candidatus Woesearchaeota archaeon]